MKYYIPAEKQFDFDQTKEKLFDLLLFNIWDECKEEVKRLYVELKNCLSSDIAKMDLLVNIYLETVADPDFCDYEKFMNSAA